MNATPVPRIGSGTGLLALLLLAVLGCAPQRRPLGTPVPAAVQQPVVLTVENECEHEMYVYVVRATSRVPLGPVASSQQRVFRLEPAVIGRGELQLLAVPDGGAPPVTSNSVIVHGGQLAEWRIYHPPQLSLLSVW